jgi:hypothetical protein
MGNFIIACVLICAVLPTYYYIKNRGWSKKL